MILDEVALNFRVVAPLFDEDEGKKNSELSPEKLAMYLAEQKALSISVQSKDAYVIGSDQVCEFEGSEISKSKDSIQANEQLNAMNGKVHFQNNAVAIALNNKIVFRSFSRVEMKMRQMTSAEIKKYIDFDQPWGCAGSYKYESLGKHLFETVDGDYYSVLGMAIQPLLSFLHEQKLIIIGDK